MKAPRAAPYDDRSSSALRSPKETSQQTRQTTAARLFSLLFCCVFWGFGFLNFSLIEKMFQHFLSTTYSHSIRRELYFVVVVWNFCTSFFLERFLCGAQGTSSDINIAGRNPLA